MPCSRGILTACAAVVVCASRLLAGGAVIHVPGDLPTIQQAINDASSGDTIVIAPGEYFENISTMGKAVTITGGARDTTVLNGGGAGSVVTCHAGEGPGTVIERLTITGGVAVNGGGISCINASPTIRDILFEGNESTGATSVLGGGAIAAYTNSSPLIDRCVFRNNTAAGLGGAIVNYTNSLSTISNCLFHDNTAQFGGAIANELQSNALIVNCTVINNDAPIAPGICNFSSTVRVVNCVVRDNGAMDVVDFTPGLGSTVMYSNIRNFAGTGNIDIDPMLDALTYAPLSGSPCIDAGDSSALPAGLVLDLAGGARLVDDVATADTGVGSGAIVDMGAFEYRASAPCAGDCDSSGVVDFNDLVSMLFEFGETGDARCDADASGEVAFNDLVAALFLFGPCP